MSTTHSDESSESTTQANGSFCIPNQFRNFLMFVAVLCLTSVNANVSAFNQVILCMKNETLSSPPHYFFTKTEELWLQRAIGMGSLVGTFPFNYGYSRLGAKWPFGIAGLFSGLCAALTPTAASWGFPWLMAARLMTGFLYAADFSVIGLMITKWSPLNRSAVYVSLLTGYTPIASFMTFASSGPACKSSVGWPLLYYCLATLTCISFVLWFIYYNDEPVKSRHLNQYEFDLISEGKFKEELQKHTKVPYLVGFLKFLIFI
uniref:MFS domain-containing protein n=1 Tax=Bursaphelenchus xylophilus TaxID=6326 RepID=A0A1I7SET7_BURXY